MSKAPAIRAAIVSTLAAVPGVGLVHAYERYAADRNKLRELYVTQPPEQPVLRGWNVRRVAFSAAAVTPGRRDVTTTWEITGYRALADAEATELAFDDLVDAIAEAFDANPTLDGNVKHRLRADPSGIHQLDAGPVLFAGVLSHAVRLRLVTEHTEIDPARTCG